MDDVRFIVFISHFTRDETLYIIIGFSNVSMKYLVGVFNKNIFIVNKI